MSGPFDELRRAVYAVNPHADPVDLLEYEYLLAQRLDTDYAFDAQLMQRLATVRERLLPRAASPLRHAAPTA